MFPTKRHSRASFQKMRLPRIYQTPWEQRKLGEVCEIKDSARIPQFPEWSKLGVSIYRGAVMLQTNNTKDAVLFISQNDMKFYKNRTGAPTKDDVLFNGGGEIGKSPFIN